MGRPSDWTPDVGEKIAQLMIEGMSLRRICGQGEFPSITTVCNWLAKNPPHPFLEQYTRAREIQTELNADELVDIADGLDGGREIEFRKKNGEEGEFYLDNQATRNRIDVRKWNAMKLLPKKYGERVAVDGAIDATHKIVVEYVVPVKDTTPEIDE